MLNQLVSGIISRIKQESYRLDSNITSKDIMIIMAEKGVQVVRGFWKGLFFKEKHDSTR